ncbi:MAG: ribosome silencing factor [Termitinemataceae bacterium]|nr:MAG: ribosome silencing factor [Termitinemataceae bacterium]
MDDTVNNDTQTKIAASLCALLKERNALGVTLLDFSAIQMWCDFFIVATVTSSTHAGGLEREINDFAKEHNITILNSRKKTLSGNEWQYCDLGDIVIHLMSEKARSFYELENLYIDAVITHF